MPAYGSSDYRDDLLRGCYWRINLVSGSKIDQTKRLQMGRYCKGQSPDCWVAVETGRSRDVKKDWKGEKTLLNSLHILE